MAAPNTTQTTIKCEKVEKVVTCADLRRPLIRRRRLVTPGAHQLNILKRRGTRPPHLLKLESDLPHCKTGVGRQTNRHSKKNYCRKGQFWPRTYMWNRNKTDY